MFTCQNKSPINYCVWCGGEGGECENPFGVKVRKNKRVKSLTSYAKKRQGALESPQTQSQQGPQITSGHGASISNGLKEEAIAARLSG